MCGTCFSDLAEWLVGSAMIFWSFFGNTFEAENFKTEAIWVIVNESEIDGF